MFRMETWKVAIDALQSNKLRAFLTMLGAVIGSACIVLVITVSLSGSRYIIGQIEGVGANLVYGELVKSGEQAAVLSDQITLDDLSAIQRAIPQVVAISGTHEVPVPWISVVLAIGVSCLTGPLFGYLPANKAAKLQPTDSLRYE
jgi:ABC-type antimicrobial peptide transport system permease subunit